MFVDLFSRRIQWIPAFAVLLRGKWCFVFKPNFTMEASSGLSLEALWLLPSYSMAR